MKTKYLHFIMIAFAIFDMQLITFKARAQASFSPATIFDLGSSPYSLQSADFNGDGKADLAMILYFNGEGNVSVLLGDGAGGFGIATNFAAGSNPTSIKCADFNGDGAIDLAVTNYDDNNVSVLLGNGMGGFPSITNFAVGINPLSLTIANFNADDKPDLAVVNKNNNSFSVLLGNGMGGFTPSTNFPVGINPVSITSADFNTDGKTDLAITYESLNSTSVLLGDGLGSFGAVTDFAIDGNYSSILSSDFNGDGHADLATANPNSKNVSVLIGNGAGSFTIPTDFMIGNGSVLGYGKIICADFDSDGKVDLAVTNYSDNNVSILLGKGTGGFMAASNFAVGMHPVSLTPGDFNGDGKPDLVVADFNDNNVSVLLNNALPQASPICLVTVDSTLSHNVVVWEKTNLHITSIDSFIVYREITINNYQRIGAVSVDSLSSFDDFAANPAAASYRYKLKNKNMQNVTSPFSMYQNTMYLTNAGADFFWTPYQIENNNSAVAAYYIFRDDNSTGNFHAIDTTTGNQLNYTDANYANFPNASYYVEAVMVAGTCQPTRSAYDGSRSNMKHIGSNGVQQLNNSAKINIYPNPATNKLIITGITGKTNLQMYDSFGNLVYENSSTLLGRWAGAEVSINTSHLAEGIYTLLASGKFGITDNKVVISR